MDLRNRKHRCYGNSDVSFSRGYRRLRSVSLNTLNYYHCRLTGQFHVGFTISQVLVTMEDAMTITIATALAISQIQLEVTPLRMRSRNIQKLVTTC